MLDDTAHIVIKAPCGFSFFAIMKNRTYQNSYVSGHKPETRLQSSHLSIIKTVNLILLKFTGKIILQSYCHIKRKSKRIQLNNAGEKRCIKQLIKMLFSIWIFKWL